MGGEPIENEVFLQRLKQTYSGAKHWGTVRVSMKRLFEEMHQFKKSKAAERTAHRQDLCSDLTKEFKLIVKAATPRKHFSTVVAANEVGGFEPKLTQVM